MTDPSAPQKDEAARLQEAGATLVASLQGLVRALTLYEANNTAVERIIGDLERSLEAWFAANPDDLRLQIIDEEVFVNGRLLRMDAALYERVTDLSTRLQAFGVGDVRFGPASNRDALQGFVEALAGCLRENQGDLAGREWPGIALAGSQGQSIASFRFQPDRLAVWLYGTLLDLVGAIYEQHEAGATPSLLPLKRTLQLTIDNMRQHGAIYQLLGAVHDPRLAPTRVRVRVGITVDLVGFGLWLGLPPTDLMTLALAGVLGGLSKDGPPGSEVAVLGRYPGLGLSAVPLTLLLHDARAVRAGKRAGLPGRVLGMVEEYWVHTTATEDRGARSAARILAGMKGGQVKWIPAELAGLFEAWKGPAPLGTLVKLSDGRSAIVIGQAEGPTGKSRPRVAPLSDTGELLDRIDLAQHPDLTLAGAPDPGRAAVRVALLDRRQEDVEADDADGAAAPT